MFTLTETYHCDFSEQYRRLAVVDDSRIVLAGGNDPITGRRSQFSSELRCLDVNSDSTLWSLSYSRNYPFSRPVITGEAVAVTREFNFVRMPTGVYSFNLADGSPKFEHPVTGLKGLSTDASSGRLFYAVEREAQFEVGAFDREGSRLSIKLPYRTRELSLLGIQTVGSDRFVATFGSGGRYAQELWSLAESRPLWRCSSQHDRCAFVDDRLLTFCWNPRQDETIEIGEIDISSGRFTVLGSFQGGAISNLDVLHNNIAIWINHNRQLGYSDLTSGHSDVLVQLNAQCPGWTDVAIIRVPNRVVTLNTNDHTKPGSELKVFSID